MTIRVGLIGAGRMGNTFAEHLANSVSGVRFAAVADPAPDVAAGVAAKYGVPKFYSNYLDLLNQKDIDAVLITTPTGTHVEVVKAAAAAGKHIFCEKPLALSVTGCDEAVAAVKAAGVKMQIGFMRRFDPSYQAAKQKIDEGLIGTPVMIKSLGRDPKRTSLEFARRENGGGIILDMGIHDFDSARWLMGSEVVRVYSEGGCLVYPELAGVGDLDNAMISLKFANGGLGNVDVSRNAVYGYDIRTEILGSEGALMIGKLQHTPILVLTRGCVTHDTIPYFMERYLEAYLGEIRHFIHCIENDLEPAVGAKDARAATAIGEAATRSYDEGRPVEISISE